MRFPDRVDLQDLGLHTFGGDPTQLRISRKLAKRSLDDEICRELRSGRLRW